jgi:hypothetical protein
MRHAILVTLQRDPIAILHRDTTRAQSLSTFEAAPTVAQAHLPDTNYLPSCTKNAKYHI